MMKKGEIHDENMEAMMGTLLRIGVMVSAGVVLLGGLLFIIQHGNAQPHYRTFKGEPAELKGVADILVGIKNLHSQAIIQFGLLILIATPIVRVLFSVVGFLLEKDYLYVLITLFVLVIVSISFFNGIAG